MGATRLLYRVLLFLWPPRVRREHGRELEILFLDCLEAARRRHGVPGYVRAWLSGMADAQNGEIWLLSPTPMISS